MSPEPLFGIRFFRHTVVGRPVGSVFNVVQLCLVPGLQRAKRPRVIRVNKTVKY